MTPFPTSGTAPVALLSPVASRGGESLFPTSRRVNGQGRVNGCVTLVGIPVSRGGLGCQHPADRSQLFKVRGGLGGPTKETPMKVYAALMTFGLVVFALSIRFAFLLAELAGRSWS